MTNRQRTLPFEGTKEHTRLARIERLLGDVPKVRTAARLFDEAAEHEANAKTKDAR